MTCCLYVLIYLTKYQSTFLLLPVFLLTIIYQLQKYCSQFRLIKGHFPATESVIGISGLKQKLREKHKIL